MGTRSPTRRASGRSRSAGLTILEVVFAMALLGMLIVSASAAISFMHKSQAREGRSLTAAELGNRIILMYLDDPQSPESEGDKITWSTGETYRWSINRSEVEFTPAVEPKDQPAGETPESGLGGATTRPTGGASSNLARLHVVRVKVWLSEDSGGSPEFTKDIPNATLCRLVDPMETVTRPDSRRRILKEYGAAAISEFLRTGKLPPRGSGGSGGSGGGARSGAGVRPTPGGGSK